MLKKFKWLVHPVSILILAQICWGLLMFVWIRWYVFRSQEIANLIEKIPLPATTSGQWVVLTQGCILMAFILVALYMIFVSQRRLVRLAKMQDTILSSVTHELKTPLASIRLYTETLLLRPVAEEDRLKFLKRTLSEAERLQSLIDTVLISARLQSFQSPREFSRLNLKDVVQASFQKAKERFSEHRFFFLNLPTEMLFVFGNNHHLSILFDNLLDNAVKYTDKGGHIHLDIHLKKDLVVVSIQDNGSGIAKENLKKIFRKFYRVQNQGQNVVKGSGLGLSVCNSIVKEHGGKIYALSDGLSKGSSFYVELKRSRSSH